MQPHADEMPSHSTFKTAFTLIELSIVLVIIGLIVGGVLVGQDLIRAAQVRATITQYEKFNTAVNTFQGKYGYLPGDIKDPEASSFGFAARGTNPGQGDGNGVLMGWSGSVNPHYSTEGEQPMVWVDLSAAHLIEGNYITASPIHAPAMNYSGSGLDLWYPAAKLGNGIISPPAQVMGNLVPTMRLFLSVRIILSLSLPR